VPLFYRKFPEKFRRKFPEISELTTLVDAQRWLLAACSALLPLPEMAAKITVFHATQVALVTGEWS